MTDYLIYRTCQECGIVARGAEFKRVSGHQVEHGAMAETAARLLRCPGCGHAGPAVGFPRVEPPNEGAATP